MELDQLRNQTFRAFLTAHVRLLEVVSREVKQAGAIPLEWYDVLLTLEEAPEQRRRMGELAKSLLFSPSGLTRLVDRIEVAGYLRREASQGDRRAIDVSLTEAGREARRRTWPIYARAIDKHFGRFLSDSEARMLYKVLERLITAHPESATRDREAGAQATFDGDE